jgi:hypothetical protein
MKKLWLADNNFALLIEFFPNSFPSLRIPEPLALRMNGN